jgi:phosphoribosylformylglycinamidine synthase
MDYEKRVHEATREIVRSGLAESVHDVSDGGLAVAVAECSFGPERVGARLELQSEIAGQYLLFHEAPSRLLLSVEQSQLGHVLEVARKHNVEAPVVGETLANRLEIMINGEQVIDASAQELYGVWDTALESLLSAS